MQYCFVMQAISFGLRRKFEAVGADWRQQQQQAGPCDEEPELLEVVLTKVQCLRAVV